MQTFIFIQLEMAETMTRNNVVMMDTCFFIRMSNANDPLHDNVMEYFRYFINHEYDLRISTIAIAEYCTKGCVNDLPLKNLLPLPFNFDHAICSGKFMREIYKEKSRRGATFGNRLIIPNDTKMFAQAECAKVQYYLTSDRESKKIYDILRDNRLIGFEFIDISMACGSYFGELPFAND